MENKQHPLCRMRDGWCRDCESSEYQKDCIEIASAPSLQSEIDRLKEERAELVKHLDDMLKYWEWSICDPNFEEYIRAKSTLQKYSRIK